MPSRSTLERTDVGDELNFARVSGAYVRVASASCLFFQWAIVALQEEYGFSDVDESWTLNVGILEGHLNDYPDLPFLQVCWKNCDDSVSEVHTPWLTILAELGWSLLSNHSPFSPSPLFSSGELICTQDNAAAKVITRRPERLNFSSKATFDQLREWISVCNKSHACRKNSELFMPSAVIEIISGPEEEPKLRIVRAPSHEEYVALSYCWGEGQPVKATQQTIDELTRNINYCDLPRTIRNAITVTLELECRFLWVDALCIIQDDEVYKAKEIALMPKIYESAYATIIAARSRSCDEGFLHDIITPDPSSYVFRFPLRGHGSSSGSILCFAQEKNHRIVDPTEDRAWTLQEFLLSRRIIRFGGYQVTWLCPCSWETQRRNEPSNWWLRREKERVDMRGNFHERLQDLSVWDQLIWDYTRRNLSKLEDRLLAISGIASKLAEKSGASYIAGMWRHHLPRGLLWEVSSSLEPRPSPYRAPSWSWASVNGRISSTIGVGSTIDPDFQILSLGWELTEQTAPYGDVNWALMTVRGRIRRLYWTNSSSTLLDLDQSQSEQDDQDTLAFTQADVSEDENHDMLSVWCLQICSFNSNDGPHGIILTEENGNVFKRRGVFQFSSMQHDGRPTELREARLRRMRSWKQSCDLRKLVIV